MIGTKRAWIEESSQYSKVKLSNPVGVEKVTIILSNRGRIQNVGGLQRRKRSQV